MVENDSLLWNGHYGGRCDSRVGAGSTSALQTLNPSLQLYSDSKPGRVCLCLVSLDKCRDGRCDVFNTVQSG
jgi:hypothetical protein